FELNSLADEDIRTGLHRAMADKERGLGDIDLGLEDKAEEHFILSSHGDVRTALNALELAALSTDKDDDGKVTITLEDAKSCMQKTAFLHDKDGDQHYDVMSAFQKSV